MEAKKERPLGFMVRSYYQEVFGKTVSDLNDEFKKELLQYVESCVNVENIVPNHNTISTMYDIYYNKKWILDYLLNPSLYKEKEPEIEKPTPKSRITSVYLIKNRRNGYTKIGHSISPKKREETLQSEEPELELVFFKEKINASVEKELHNQYQEKRIRGEWFNLSDLDIQEIIKKLNSL